MSRLFALACNRPLIGAFLLAGLVCVLDTRVSLAQQVATKPARPSAQAVVTAHPQATAAGMEILAAGGNAFDAAVAVSAALAVVEPYSSGIGGGGFWLLHRAEDGKQVMLDGRERAPLAAHRDLYLTESGEVDHAASLEGALAAGIPGEPAALVHLAEHYGRLPLARSLAPAIRLAEDGFKVDEQYRKMAQFRLELLRQHESTAKIFLQDGAVPEPEAIIVQEELAATLRALAEHGHAGFYRGAVAQRLVQGVRAAGGIWTLEDLQQYQAVERQPVSFQYRDYRVVSASPPSSGGIALATMLHILEGWDLRELDTVTRTHVIVEAMRRAYRDRAQYLGDPDFVDVPTTLLTSRAYASGLRASIREDRATPSAELPGRAAAVEGSDTSHFSILDRDGNRVAATLSINYPFGSGLVIAGTGVLLNDEMDDFSARPGEPNAYGLVGAEANAVAAGKRPLSSMSPTFVESERGVAVLGTPGGSRIITMVLLGILELESGRGPDAWVSARRFHHQYLPDAIQYEKGALDPETQRSLQRMGHQLDPLERDYGNMQALYWEYATGEVDAASDPRGLGQAMVR
jgi:gamma-glutamyltranspeptidase/glutathione hydrolase